ncbi:MAG TPA: hypothetical protein VLB29_17480 [Nocardioidaceae bacterium]|nr:hypothetical protein [Nocardioidaceae bacterium]
MRRVLSIVLLAIALLGSSLMLTSANADHQNYRESSYRGGDSFRLLAVSDQFEEIDVGRRGFSIGDYVAFNDKLYFRRSRVGTLDGTCVVTRLHRRDEGAQQCVVTLTLPRGHLTAQGLLTFEGDEPDPFTVAITGGTGRYSNAAGEAHVRILNEDRTLIDIDLEN